MEALYHQTNKLVEEIQSHFSKLEKCTNSEAESLESEIQKKIDIINRLIMSIIIAIFFIF